jgi:hypothetical protein
METKFLEKLRRLTAKSGRPVPLWLEDLLLHGPRLEHWPSLQNKPNRVTLTEFLARWSKFAGLSQEECLEWLLPYCCEVLARYSKSSPSDIRHGTNSNTRYVYATPYAFDFETLAGDLPGTMQGYPAYFPVLDKWRELLEEMKRIEAAMIRPQEVPPPRSVKEKYRQQFEEAVEFARRKSAEGTTLIRLAELLNEQGFLTRTGRKWTVITLVRALGPKKGGAGITQVDA